MLYELGRFFLLSIHQKITKTLQGALFLSTDAENHRSNAHLITAKEVALLRSLAEGHGGTLGDDVLDQLGRSVGGDVHVGGNGAEESIANRPA